MFGGLERGPEPQRMSDINVTPLVDVMLVLLVIFIITAPLLVHSIALELPREDAAATEPAPRTITLSIDAQGKLFWDESPVADAELAARLKQAAAAPGAEQPEIALRADRATRYERIAFVLAAAQAAGLSRLGFVTEPAPAP